jgi:hypothetical protein
VGTSDPTLISDCYWQTAVRHGNPQAIVFPDAKTGRLGVFSESADGLRNNAAFMIVAEDEYDEDQCITFNLAPGEVIVIGYANQKHQDTASPIAVRVAEVLGYDAEDI